MLSREQSRLIVRVGPGTPMGSALRAYWLPAVLSDELETEGAPLRVRLLGEDLIAFRDTSGQVGLVAHNCPHRGASLFFGRNEEGGLRCVYHGWKFDASGACVDMPNESYSPEGTLGEGDDLGRADEAWNVDAGSGGRVMAAASRQTVRAVAYPCVERGGLVWAYLGPPERTPAPPDLEFTLVPDSHHYVTKYPLECNYLQGMEGELDSSHVSFLHSTLKPELSGLNRQVLGQ